jgi:hypothetical protein
MGEKFKRIYEGDYVTSIWTYDPDVSKVNPISVEHRWKNPKDLVNQKTPTMKDMVPKKKKKSTKPKNNDGPELL